MLKRHEVANPESCLNKADDNEPVFVLRANDPLAPSIVSAWARDYIVEKGGWSNMSDNQKKKYTEAMDLAGHMRIWMMHKHKRGSVR